MTSTSRGLGGRSLTATRQQAAETRIIKGAPEVLLDELLPSPENGRDVRKESADPRAWQKVLELAEAFRTDGVNTALTVVTAAKYLEHYPQHEEYVRGQGRPYVVIHGHRRLAAAREAGLVKVPVLLKQEVADIRIAAIQENLLREGLDPLAEGQQYQLALAESGLSQRALAKRLGNVSQTTISHRLALLQTVPEVQQKVLDEFYEPKSGITAAFAAKHLARVLPAFQGMFVRGEITSDRVVALSATLPEAQQRVESGALTLDFVYEHLSHLRDEYQEMFLQGEITAQDVAEIGKVPARDQRWPVPGEVIAGQSPDGVEDASVPGPRPESSAAGQEQVIAGQSPAPAGGASGPVLAASTSAAPEAGTGPAAAGDGDTEVIAEQSPVVGLDEASASEQVLAVAPAAVALPGTAAASAAVIAGQSPELAQVLLPAQPDTEPSVLLIGSPSAQQIAQALREHLAPEVIAAVREFLT